MNENDLRVVRSRRLLQEALIELVKVQGYDDISIRDITKQAQVGYKTFFRHYEGKEALLQAIIDAYMQQFQLAMAPHSEPDAVRRNTLTAFQLASENIPLFYSILNSPKAELLIEPLISMSVEHGRELLGGLDVPLEVVGQHFAGSILSIFKWWISNDQPYVDQRDGSRGAARRTGPGRRACRPGHRAI